MWNITTQALLYLGVILVVDVFFHYLYILTIPSDMRLVQKLSDWSLGGWSIHGNKSLEPTVKLSLRVATCGFTAVIESF